MSYENVKSFRNRLKERATYVLGGECQICGYDKCIQALDFHHVNPEEKTADFNTNANRSWQTTREEIKKCVLLCANCHREVHAGLIPLETLSSSFNEEKAKEIDQLVEDVKRHKINYCPSCGTEIGGKAKCCVACAHLEARITARPSREEMKELIRTIPFTQIGKRFGVTDNAIRKWCKSMGLPSKSSEIKAMTDEEWQQV